MNDFIKKLADKKNMELLITLIVMGVVLMVSSKSIFGGEKDEDKVLGDLSLDAELDNILSKIENVGDVEVLVTYKGDNKSTSNVKGVVVVATGGDNKEVSDKIKKAVQVSTGIDLYKIEVFKKGDLK